MTAAAISLRLGTSRDVRSIALMSRDLIETGLGWKYNAAKIARLVADPETLTLVACDRLGLAGFSMMQFGDERAHLLLLAVRPRCQRQGVARRMLQWLLESARCAGVAELSLELRAGNAAARALYGGMGFRDAGLVPGYYSHQEAALRMQRVLRTSGPPWLEWKPPSLRRP